MKIGIYDPYLDTLGGGEKYMLTAASYLSEKNSVYLFWPQYDEQKIKEGALERFGLNISSVSFTENIFSSKTSSIERIFKARKYDAIFYLSDGSIPFLPTKKFIVHFQFPVNWVSGINPILKIKFLFINKIVSNSCFTKEFIDKTFSIKSIVIYPPPNDYNLKNLPKKNLILTVGRFNSLPEGGNFKKLDIMIDVFKEMVDNGLKNWEFVIVLSYKTEEEKHIKDLEYQAKKYPISIQKNVSYEELNQLYEFSKIYWHAAGFGEDMLKNPERAEHFGIATVEAMKNGVVPVVVNSGGQPEIVEDGKNGFLWNTKKELIKKTSRLINDSKLLEKTSLAARRISDKFSKEKFCSEIAKLFE